MDKIITPTVIGALVIGAIVGYFIHTQPSSPATPQTSSDQTIALPSVQPGSSEDKIQQALSAVPETVAKIATVMDYPAKEGEAPVELQKGTNDWTCLPDYPASPGIDPMCLDKTGMVWLNAYITQGTPNLSQVGMAYMLRGGQ